MFQVLNYTWKLLLVVTGLSFELSKLGSFFSWVIALFLDFLYNWVGSKTYTKFMTVSTPNKNPCVTPFSTIHKIPEMYIFSEVSTPRLKMCTKINKLHFLIIYQRHFSALKFKKSRQIKLSWSLRSRSNKPLAPFKLEFKSPMKIPEQMRNYDVKCKLKLWIII